MEVILALSIIALIFGGALRARIPFIAVPAETRIVKRGAAGRSLYVLMAGSTAAVAFEPAMTRVLETHAPGALFGEIAALTHVPRQIDVLAVQPSTVVELEPAAVAELLDNPAARALLIEQLLVRWRRLRTELGAG